MQTMRVAAFLAIVAAASAPAQATGLATCNSGPQTTWQPQEVLAKKLQAQGWQIRRIKIDGGCYEVYAINDKGQRVESYFHPVTLDHVLTSTR